MRLIGVLLCILSVFSAGAQNEKTPLFMTDIKMTGNGELLMTSKGDKALKLYDATGQKMLKSWKLAEIPTGVAVTGKLAYVTCFGEKGEVAVIDLSADGIVKTIPAFSGACAPLLSADGTKLYVCNQFAGTVSAIDLAAGSVVQNVPVLREPKSMVMSPDGKTLFVTNFLPAQRADLDYVAACVSVIDIPTFTKRKDIVLENGSNAVRGLCLSPDGKYLFISHNLGRFTVPTSQLQQGWMNTSAVSVVDVAKEEFMGAVLVDEPERGAAGIWGLACDGDKMIITHSGVHEISVIDYPELIKKFEAYPDKKNLNYDLRFLYGVRERVTLKGNGPRNFIISDHKAYIPTYFSDDLNVYDLTTGTLTQVALNPGRVETPEQKGERMFNDALYCFQNWQSCNGCHPGDARTDAMNWDLMNDGVGNSKNCKSMLFSHVTPPSMISGIRAMAEVAVRKGFYHIQFYEVSEEDAQFVDDYMKSLKPVPSPLLVNGELSEKAKKGRKVFEALKCDECHSGPYYTDMKMHRIGEDIEFEKGWDTPTLREVWRTAPYLFDGRAATMEDVFKEHKHGVNKKLSKTDLDALVEYVNSL